MLPVFALLAVVGAAVVVTWGAARQDMKLTPAAFAVFLDNALSLYMTTDEWAIRGVLSWACLILCLAFVSRISLVLSVLFALELAAHIAFGIVRIWECPGPDYAGQMLEYRIELPYWWTCFAVALCQCGLLIGYTGGSGGKRNPSTGGALRRLGFRSAHLVRGFHDIVGRARG